jgi:hypothetical protein
MPAPVLLIVPTFILAYPGGGWSTVTSPRETVPGRPSAAATCSAPPSVAHSAAAQRRS